MAQTWEDHQKLLAELEPVSYTHLDVYKRQPYNSPAVKLYGDTLPVSANLNIAGRAVARRVDWTDCRLRSDVLLTILINYLIGLLFP